MSIEGYEIIYRGKMDKRVHCSGIGAVRNFPAFTKKAAEKKISELPGFIKGYEIVQILFQGENPKFLVDENGNVFENV